MPNMNDFSFGQMTSNSDGKTSGSGTMGILICTVGSLCFLLGAVDKLFVSGNIDVITQSIIFVGIGATLLGFRKSKDGAVKADDNNTPTEQLNS
jgi:hypothetical protein